MLRAARILKSAEPRLTVAKEVQHQNDKLRSDLKVLNLQKVVLEEQKVEAVGAQQKAEEDLKSAGIKLEDLRKEKDGEIKDLSVGRRRWLQRLRDFEQCEELTEDAKAAISATEGAHKAQLAILASDFDFSQISFLCF
ncbi:hypothetical protein PIB30_079541 [Stylosanthes scabra]|uniref:Uncharacterized protein n=1 Tax=Stylosanthes scabra TaxID=79078 RepID=A0ABU6ST44_9FABA|nr:hypothetical protein [Stylosanthes scabra]